MSSFVPGHLFLVVDAGASYLPPCVIIRKVLGFIVCIGNQDARQFDTLTPIDTAVYFSPPGPVPGH